MNWFWFAIIALLCWSGSDFFSKIGCRDASDKYSHLKMILAVGVVMGLHAAYEIFIGGVEINLQVIWTYLPVSLLYILSMAMGYIGLRYIELSISSPICNASGALVAIATIVMAMIGGEVLDMVPMQYAAVGLAAVGVIGLGFVEANEDEQLRTARQSASNFKYAKSWLALALPVAYCLLDAAGTFADSIVLESLNEDSANVAYELTFLATGIVSLVFLLIKKQKFLPKMEGPKYIGAIFETVGQFAYIYALADEEHVAMSAPIISAYCAVSVLWSRLFLKEKLSWKHYACIATTIAGIIIMGVYDM
ncbi:MAG: EamA family transporter [Oscillospiraceae bacterium]|nr:EamA family transporter [Oscillospiraceae bacterium]